MAICVGLLLTSILGAAAHARRVNYQSLSANVNGVKIHYLKAGTGNRTLVLIHGFGDVWEKIYTTPALWHLHFVNSPVALELVKGRERLFLEHFWQTGGVSRVESLVT